MHAIERLRRLTSLPAHFRAAATCISELLRRTEIFGPVIEVRRFVLLLVAHDAFPFPSPSKNVNEAARVAPAHRIAPRDPRFYPRVR